MNLWQELNSYPKPYFRNYKMLRNEYTIPEKCSEFLNSVYRIYTFVSGILIYFRINETPSYQATASPPPPIFKC